MSDAPITEFNSLAGVAKRLPNGTVCLLSALVFHGITTQLPSGVWVALPRGSRTPRLDNRKLRVVRFAGRSLTEGRAEHRLEGVPVMIYSSAKTVAIASSFETRSDSTLLSKGSESAFVNGKLRLRRSGVSLKSAEWGESSSHIWSPCHELGSVNSSPTA
jgi:hypothetical protein